MYYPDKKCGLIWDTNNASKARGQLNKSGAQFILGLAQFADTWGLSMYAKHTIDKKPTSQVHDSTVSQASTFWWFN